MSTLRTPAVAGQFYPGDAVTLSSQIRAFLGEAGERVADAPKAIIAPHAGYIYSGPVAAHAYAHLTPLKDTIRRVVLLGPCHRVPVNGMALSSAEAFTTPLGRVDVDHSLDETLLTLPGVQVYDDTHTHEHSLEVHIPFLQTVLGTFLLLPIVVGQAAPQDVAAVLEQAWGGSETLIVVSTDLSHYLAYDAAQAIDRETCTAIEHLDPAAITDSQACGRMPLKGLLALAKDKGMNIRTLDLRNSGDTAGPRDRVVGYGAWALWESGGEASLNSTTQSQKTDQDQDDVFAAKTRALLNDHGDVFLQIAKGSIVHALSHGGPLVPAIDTMPPEMTEIGACFVTLNKNDRLRGCIGSPEAWRPLATDVAENAYRAAFKDPRFPPLKADEADELDIHLSVLSPAHPITFTDEGDLMYKLRPNVDGLIIEDMGRRALFLPSVWKQLPDARPFLEHLKVKAGLGANHWSDTFKAYRFIAAETGAAWDDIPLN